MIHRVICLIAFCSLCFAADNAPQPSLTIYNQNFHW